ncbi:uncharacterized protein LOC105844737 isoform X3 [Hydra vulgaris]|uniref:uncharacterized protein LOC105844737 isoform X3 n=1 Tax=Hydra vulgaris TaxID=6087 RepID=UPI0032EA25D7
MKILLFLITFYARFRSAFAQYCINDGVTDFQLTSSGYYVDSSISCVSVCNSYSPGVFFYAFYLEKQLCFCKNSSQLNITPSNCSTTQCLIGSTNCILSNYEYFPLSLGIIDWEITFNPNPALVDNEVQIQTKISKGDASSAYVIPTTNGLTTNGLPSDVQSVIGTTVKTHFYLPGLQLWSQKIGNNYSNPINTSVWLQIDEKVGGVFVNPLIVDVNGFYNFFLVITQGTRVSVNISLPMNKNVNFTADVICLSYGLDLSMFYNTSDGTCSLKNGFILNQVILSSGYLKKIKLKVSDTGTLKIAILRPSISSTIFCALGSSCTNTLNTFNPVTALVVKKFLFSLPIKGIIEIPMQNIAVEENDVIWIGGSASLYCNGVNYAPMVEMDLGSIVTFSMNETNNNGFFISFFVSKPIEYYIPVTTNTPGLFNFVVDASNNVSSSRRLNYSYPIQIPISGLRFANNKPFSKDIAGYKLNGWLTLQAVIDNGTDVMYLFDIPKLKFSSYVSSGSVNFKLTTLGVFTVYLTAGNKLNSVNTSIEIAVLSEISSIQLYAENNQLQNSSYSTSVTIFNGTNVYLILDFGDGTPVLSLTNINATGMNGFTYTISHMYSVCDIYTITAYVSNVLVTSSGVFNATIISSKKVAVFCILSQLNVITTPTVSLNGYVELPITKSLMLNIFQDIGSYRNYSIDWGDGTYSYNNQSVLNLNVYFPVMFQVQHMYEKEDMYNVSITCKNALQKLNYVVQVQVKSCSVPYVSFYYGTSLNPVSVFRNYDKDFIGFIEKVKVSCQSKTSTFEWNLTSSNLKPIISRQKGIESQQKIMYTIAKGSLDVGFYTLSLQYTYGETSTVYSAYVNVLFSPLIMDIENGFFNSIAYKKKNGNESFYQNFTISAENSNDPDDPTVGIKGITFTWRCKVATNFSDAQIVMANFTSLNSTFGGDACFNETWVNISSTSPSIKFSTQQFLEGINYHFEVCGTKYAGKDIYSKDQYKTSCFIQQFLIIAASAPTITLKCISNCATKLNFQERVIYSFVCEDCGSRRLVAKWIITSDASTEPLTDNDTTTGFSTPSLVIKRDILLETKNYTFNLIVGYADSISRASFEFTKTVCSKPTGGVCYVNPASGYALDTKFSIVCYGWRDADGLLFYRFYYDNGQIERMNLSSTNSVDYPLLNAATIDQPSLVNFVMGPGDQKNDYKIIIFLRVSNKYNAYTEQNFTIMVKPNKKLLNITDLLIDVNLNDTQSVSNLVQAISSTSNKNSSSLNKVSSTSNNEVRTQVISLINNLPIIDLNSFKSVSDGLVLSIKYPSEITSQAQNQAANIVERLSGYLTKQNLKGFGADSFDTLTQSLLNSISSLFLTDFNSTDPGSPFIPDNKTASSGTETTATTTTSAAFSNLTLDETSTNFLVTKCKCTHLTTFGGFFIAPNPLLPLSLALFKQGYILTVAVAVVILLWLLCLPFTRRMDKQDESKIGVCPLYDNREGETYLYQIIVHTGDIRNAGTKSNIFLTVAGDISESGVRHLKDPVRKCFQRSSCDVFIMSTCSSLGNLDFIRLWHDNSGGGWYLRNIIIIDLQTEKEFLFIGHRWMAVDRGNCLVDCVIPVASVEESTNFNYVFKTKAQHKLLDEHLWLSVLTRLPQSNFTRCQRLSVAFSLIMTSMMVSAMFYHGYKNEPEIENGLFNFSFDKKKIFVILICSCIKFPVELIFVKLFCTIRPFQNLEMSSDDISQNKDNKIEKNLSLSCSQLLQKNSLTSTDTATCIACEENRKSSSTKTISKKCFPVLCLYMTWFICIGSIFGCGFIVLWYGMSFGNNQSLHWLTIIIVDLVKEILLFAPIKIFISAIIISLVVKKVSEDKSEIKNKGKALALNESWLHKQKDKSLIFNKDDVNIQPPDPVSLKKMRDLRLKQLKMYSLMTELILYFFYAIFAFRIGYFARENVAFYQTRNIQELFNLTLRGVPLPKDYSKIYGKIQSSKHFWSWMEELFFPQVYPDPWYNLSAFYSNTSQQNFPGKLFLNDLTSKIVNGIRIRQVRIQPDSCKKAYLMSKFIKVDCLSSYASSLEETRDFDLNWKIPKQYNSPIIPSTMPWRYQTWKELDGYPYAADLDIYYGGGYVLEIFPKWKNKALLEQLKNSRWIDRQTRAVIIEFALFNAATNYFTMVTMALEFPASGGVVPTSSILTFQLFSSGTDIYVWHVLFILMVLVLTIRHCHLLYHGCKYFLEFWSLVESLMILFSVIAVGFFFFKGYLVKMLLQRLPDKKPQTFINFQFASYWDLVYVNLISIVIFFVTLKFIKLLQFNRRISMVSYTLKVAWYPLTMFGIVFFIILCSFVSSSAIIFGPFMDDYKTFLNTITSVVSLLLGRFSFIQYKNANSFLGPVFFYGFNIIVIWIIMNMFVSILNDAFRKVRTKPDNQTNDYEIIEFFLEQLKDLFGYRWIKQENTFSYQNEKIFDIKHESDTYKRVSHSNGILSKTSDFNKDSVENEVFYTLDSKNTIYASFPKKKYLLNSNEREISVNESFNTFINCVNLLYLKKSKHE